MLKEKLDRLVDYVAQPGFDSETRKAKKEYEQLAGEIFEDDKSFETRTLGFLEWFILDRWLSGQTDTPLETFIRDSSANLEESELEEFRCLLTSVHSLFQVKKVKTNLVTVTELFDDNRYEVSHERADLLFKKNDLFEGRLFYYQKMNQFSDSFCFHPLASQKFIKVEIERLIEHEKSIALEIENLHQQITDNQSKINKTQTQIDKFRKKIEKADDSQRREMEDSVFQYEVSNSNTQSENTDLEKLIADKKRLLKFECQHNRKTLILKLSYMNLRWERSRLISLEDIYTN